MAALGLAYLASLLEAHTRKRNQEKGLGHGRVVVGLLFFSSYFQSITRPRVWNPSKLQHGRFPESFFLFILVIGQVSLVLVQNFWPWAALVVQLAHAQPRSKVPQSQAKVGCPGQRGLLLAGCVGGEF